MDLIKTTFLTAASTLVKLGSGFVVNKLIAVYIGPTGLAILGQFRDFFSLIGSFGSGATDSGIVKYTSENESIKERSKILISAVFISICVSILLSSIIFGFKDVLSYRLIGNSKYIDVFILAGLFLPIISINSIILNFLNGIRCIKEFVLINISSSLVNLTLISILTFNLGIKGALYALILSPGVVFFFPILTKEKLSSANSF